MIKLIGIAVVALGFALRLNTLLVVMAAGICTGLAAGVPLDDLMADFGRAFVENRYVTLPVVLMLPVIGLLEEHGLRERAETLVRRVKAATPGRVLLVYTAIRQISISLGVNIGGHPAMVRPLVAPMAEAAARSLWEGAALPAEAAAQTTGHSASDANSAASALQNNPAALRAEAGPLPDAAVQTVRAHAAAAENVGNFFGEDTVFAVSAVLLIHGVLEAQGVKTSVWELSFWGIPTALIAFGCMAWRALRLDGRLRHHAVREQSKEDAAP